MSENGDYASVPASPERGVSPGFDWELQDRELQGLGLEAARATTPAVIEDLAVVHRRFDMHAIIDEGGGARTVVPHDRLRRLLRAIPPYIESANGVGVEPEQAYRLIRRIMTAEQRSEYSAVHPSVNLLTRALTWQGLHGHQLSPDDQADLGDFLARAGDKNDDELMTRVYAHLSRLGFTSSQSTRFIGHDLRMDNLVLDRVGRLVHTLYGAKIEPEVLCQSCRLMLGDWNDYNAMERNFTDLTEMVYRFVASLDIPANDLLRTVNDRISAGQTLDSIAADYMEQERRTAIAGVAVHDHGERTEKHFPPLHVGRQLELASLPYRLERSLLKGMTDLGRIAVGGTDYGEGFWVFASDAEEPTWYSLGGRTVTDAARGAVSYQYPPYPIGEISDRPYIFHCHPEALAGFGNTSVVGGSIPPRAIPVINRLTTITPSGRDYLMIAEFFRERQPPSVIRSFIAHSLGFTECTFPNNPDAIEEVGHNVRAWRDAVIREAEWSRLLTHKRLGGLRRQDREPNEVATQLVGRLAKRLPTGFSLRLIAPGAQIDSSSG